MRQASMADGARAHGAAGTIGQQAPEGDAALAGLLAAAGVSLDVAGLRDLVAGVNAAPPGEDPEAWMRLVVAEPAPELRAALRALQHAMAGQDGPPGPNPVQRVPDLRAELARRGLAGFLVPRADEHQGEYVPTRAERLAWLTGFTGSAGLAILLGERAAVFVDGRYTLQVRQQVDTGLWETHHMVESPAADWVAANLPKGGRLSYDPRLHTEDQLVRLRAGATRVGGVLEPLDDNPLDAVWIDQPPAPIAPVVPHDLRFAGRPGAAKRQEIADRLSGEGLDAAVLTAPDSIAWLLNIRGGDVPRTPLPLSFAIVSADSTVSLFIDRRKLAPETVPHLGNGVEVQPPDAFGPALTRLGEGGRGVLVDSGSAGAWVVGCLAAGGARIVRGADPCALPKACKNATELEGMRAAHRRDGAAMARFLAWFAANASGGGLTELDAEARLAEERRKGEHFRDFSFDTISGAGPNGAIVHYRVTAASNRRIEPGMLFLVDSGAQYLDGTTDITRTVAVGCPGAEERDRFTRVLKGHIALATAMFPVGTSGGQLDSFARRPLWEAGLDFDHGTGHGVGSFLSVHEGPQRISKAGPGVALQPGMVISNEPGFYKTGAYGIRIENLVAVMAMDTPPGGDRSLLGLETLTLAPIDRALVERALLSPAELAWLDAYHARVRAEIAPLLDGADAVWLARATAPLAA